MEAGGGSGFVHYVGELYDNGIVVAVWKEGGLEHGLLASLNNVNLNSKIWHRFMSVPYGCNSLIDGRINSGYALGTDDLGAFWGCNNYGPGWYLPAINELYFILANKFILNTILSASQIISEGHYHSSTEDPLAPDTNSLSMYTYYNKLPTIYTNDKDNPYNTRAVKRF